MDPQQTEDGKPFAPIRYKQIVKECYIISKNIHTSYNDVRDLTPTERNYIIEFLVEEAKQREQMLQKQKAERQAKKHY